MSLPIVTPDDLALYLGTAVDNDRALLLIAQAQLLCEITADPLPAPASVIVLSAAARGYVNPQGITGETVGPYTVQRPAAGVYLTRSERIDLKFMAGRGGAFTVDPTPDNAGTGLPWWDVDVDPSVAIEVWQSGRTTP